MTIDGVIAIGERVFPGSVLHRDCRNAHPIFFINDASLNLVYIDAKSTDDFVFQSVFSYIDIF